MNTNEIRKRFLDFFKAKGHAIVPSSSLVPGSDPTLLFTNAGMVPFKDVFLGREQRPYQRAASAQRCVRAGGKHNDLENVGYTARHHTFFEMLGNFSFGDYFKRDAIRYAWELLTDVFKLPAERLWVTVYETDDEAYDIWAGDIGVPKARIVRVGDNPDGGSDNFWQMADTGPCGPCTEIFYDHGPEVEGGPPGSKDAEGDRYIEIWNLVFMQYDRDAAGILHPLPKPCVDTGMGLERVAAVLQGVHSNYEIDLFQELIHAAAELLGTNDYDSPSLKVIADHIRSCGFLIVDGIEPSNEGRGYVLRRIARRAMRYGTKFGKSPAFFHNLVPVLVKTMGDAYPELKKKEEYVKKVLFKEGEQFARTMEMGMSLLESEIEELSGKIISGDIVFKLYDTYGFPVDLTADVARERGLDIDRAGFEAAMEKQRERARAASSFGADYSRDIEVEGETEFTGYERLKDKGRITALFRGTEVVDTLAAGEEGIVVLDNTSFYAESGGQVGDTGVLKSGNAVFEVRDTQKRGNAIAHLGILKMGGLKTGQEVTAEVDSERRHATVLNHSATHLLHAALRKVLGTHVTQKGSLVAPDRLRFDFSHPQPLTPEELRVIEELVNAEIRRNAGADVRHMSYDEAIKFGALALFGEKYGDTVRVMKFGDFSTELCGGTHVSRTGDIGLFKIIGEGGVAAGIRRIEAVTGAGALAHVRETEDALRRIAGEVKADRGTVEQRVGLLVERNRAMEKELQQLRGRLAGGQGADLGAQAVDIGGLKVLAARLDGADAKALREAVDRLKSRLQSAAIVLGAVDGDKVRLAAGVTRDYMDKVPAGELINVVAEQVGGRGGGRPDMAQAGGNAPDKLDMALRGVPAWVRSRLTD